jgi:hypothetical protein
VRADDVDIAEKRITNKRLDGGCRLTHNGLVDGNTKIPIALINSSAIERV